MRCPKCRTLTLAQPAAAGEAGTLARCARCDAVWVARPDDRDRRPGAEGRPPPLVARPPLIVEGGHAPAAAVPRRWFAAWRAGAPAGNR